ncbi:MAG: Zn-ribbon domain-containing OB-fold protein [Myxococcota bacterium]
MSEEPREPLKYITTPVHLEYDHSAGVAATRFLKGLLEKKIMGARTGPDAPVMVPPRGADPRTSELAQEMVEVKDTGTVVTFSVIRVPSENIKFELPYVCISVLCDGAGVPMFHVLQNCPLEDVRIGMRVKAKWVPDDQLTTNIGSIEYFEPTGEPDVPFEQLKEHT